MPKHHKMAKQTEGFVYLFLFSFTRSSLHLVILNANACLSLQSLSTDALKRPFAFYWRVANRSHQGVVVTLVFGRKSWWPSGLVYGL